MLWDQKIDIFVITVAIMNFSLTIWIM